MKNRHNAVLDKSLAHSLAVTINITPKDAAFLKDHIFWTGETPEQLITSLYADYAKPNGEGEDHLWNIARDPQKRAAAFRRNNLGSKEMAALNRSLDVTIEKVRKAWERETVKSLKRLPPQKRSDFLRNIPSEDVDRFLTLAAS